MVTAQPDIEIYVKNTSIDMIETWLKRCFTGLDEDQLERLELDSKKPVTFKVFNHDAEIETMITPQAAGKAYCSIWFKSNQTPWQDDLQCAESFLEIFDTEVRCSAATWTEEEEEFSEKWWKLTRDNRELVAWS